MSKRFNTMILVAILLVAPSLVFAASVNQFAVGKVMTTKANTITVPLTITNDDNLTAIDIPLKFSEGVTLKEVTFEGTRTEYFDLKVANINNQEHSVIIGLLPQITATPKPDLKAGTGPVANLVFEVEDPAVKEITLETFQTTNPGHFLAFVYHDFDENGVPHSRLEQVDFEKQSFPITASKGDIENNMPQTFGLSQNYPNPFNPTTNISFDVPVASHVELSIFNVLGQKVETLVDQELEPGTHQVEWDASRYSSGIYFYRISADNFTETKKMAFVK